MGTKLHLRDRFSEKQITAFICIASFFVILVALILNLLYRVNIDGKIVALTTDTLFSIISIVVSFLSLEMDDKTRTKFKLTKDEYQNYKRITKITFYSMSILSIALLVADALFFVFDLRLCLIVTFFIILFVACYILIPFINGRRNGDDVLVNLAYFRFSNYVELISDWENISSHENDNDDNIVTNKIMTTIFLEKGFSKVKDELLEGASTDFVNLLKEWQLFIYYINLLGESISKIDSSGENGFKLTSHDVTQYINSYIDIIQIIKKSKFGNDNFREDLSIKISEDILKITNIALTNGYFNQNFECFDSLIYTLLDCGPQQTNDNLCYFVLDCLLFDSLNNGNIWAYKSIATNATKLSHINSYTYYNYLYFFMFLSLFLVSDKNNAFIIDTADKNEIKETFTINFDNYIKYLFNNYLNEKENYFDRVPKILKRHLEYLENSLFDKLMPSSLKETILKLDEVGVDVCMSYPIYFLTMYCFQNKDDFCMEEALHNIGPDLYNELEKYLTVESFAFKQSHLKDFYHTFVDLGISNDLIKEDEIPHGCELILSFSSRKKEEKKLKRKYKFNDDLNYIKDSFEKLDNYNDTPSISTPNCELVFCPFVFNKRFNKNDLTLLKDQIKLIFKDPAYILRDFLFPSSIFRAYSNRITCYNNEILDEIIKFSPSTKYSPVLDEYLKTKNSKKSKLLKDIKDYSDDIFTDHNDLDLFFKENAFSFNITIDNNKTYIRNCQESEIDSIMNDYLVKFEEDKYVYKSENNKTLYFSSLEEARNYIEKNFLFCRVVITIQFAYNKDKILGYRFDNSPF